MLTNEQFDRTRRLALRLAGIELHERHRQLLHHRYARTTTESGGILDTLLDAAEHSDPVAGRRFVTLVTTNFTGFFRHPWHFDIAAEHALWLAHRRRKARLWCAAAATGEEPYSLGMALLDVFRRNDPPVTILASDIDEDALDIARRGEYGEKALGPLGGELRARHFEELAPGERWRINTEVRRFIEFRTLNLAVEEWPVEGAFDVIFCRNVVMYLEAGHRRAVLEHLASHLTADGLLILDPAEHLGAAAPRFSQRAEGLYQLRKMPTEPVLSSRLQ